MITRAKNYFLQVVRILLISSGRDEEVWADEKHPLAKSNFPLVKDFPVLKYSC